MRVDISSGGTHLGGTTLVPGYNQYSVSGLTTGTVTTTVTDASGGTILSSSGPMAVSVTLYDSWFRFFLLMPSRSRRLLACATITSKLLLYRQLV